MTTANSSSQRFPRKRCDVAERTKDSAANDRPTEPAQETAGGFEQRILSALEQERARIARELHDDINQRIAILIWESQKLDICVSGEEGTLRKCLERITEHLQRLATDIQTIAHRLHPSHLEYLGLAAAAETLCRDLCSKHQVEINFTCRGIRRDLSKDISLCLYRVLQEGLQNAIKHSRVQQFSVELIENETEVRLTIMDEGIGFEPTEAEVQQGLGLISMRERIRLVHGDFSVESAPGSGTTIRCGVGTRTMPSQSE
jgi:signal transduction histidine kinase